MEKELALPLRPRHHPRPRLALPHDAVVPRRGIVSPIPLTFPHRPFSLLRVVPDPPERTTPSIDCSSVLTPKAKPTPSRSLPSISRNRPRNYPSIITMKFAEVTHSLSSPPLHSSHILRRAMIEIGAHTATEPRIKVIQTIAHEGEVNRARYMPQNPDLIATKTNTGELFVFDRTKHPNEPTGSNKDECKPDITLRGQAKEGCVQHIVSYAILTGMT